LRNLGKAAAKAAKGFEATAMAFSRMVASIAALRKTA
jgi:hypothetical protein